MARPIGAHFHVPHGLSIAMLLPVVTAFSAPTVADRYANVACAMGVASEGDSSQAAVTKLLNELPKLNRDLEVPTPKAYGIDGERWTGLLGTMAGQALASGSPANNPRVPTPDEIQQLYRKAWA
jgi:alcohol dehydrogenase class IV